MNLTQKEIAQIRKELEAEFMQLAHAQDKVFRKLRKLEAQCKHPRARRIGPMGMERLCPDCGYRT